MTWTLDWHPVARKDLLSIPWQTAARLDAALIRFAATNRGPVERTSAHDPRRMRLVVQGAVAVLFAEPTTGILLVSRAFGRPTT